MTKLVKAHNYVSTDQKEFKPQDENVLYLLNSACEVGFDSPKKFQSYIKECMEVVEKNHQFMIKSYKSNSKSNGR
jgi:hypothetical protein